MTNLDFPDGRRAEFRAAMDANPVFEEAVKAVMAAFRPRAVPGVTPSDVASQMMFARSAHEKALDDLLSLRNPAPVGPQPLPKAWTHKRDTEPK